MRAMESVNLGIRLYEETKDPSVHAYNGKVKSIDEIQSAIDAICAKLNNPKFYIFCVKRNDIFKSLNLPDSSIFITEYDANHIEQMWLMTQCRHHIITNSTYYWWGAWLSKNTYLNDNQIILAANNFINQDIILPEWQTF